MTNKQVPDGLEPCPFCGGDTPSLVTNDAAGMSWVACPECGLEAPSETGTSADDAVTYWNRRAYLAASPSVGLKVVARFRHDCAKSGHHDHDGCCCGDDELLRRASQAQAALAAVTKERDEALGAGERQWAGWVAEEVRRKAAEAQVSRLTEENEALKAERTNIITTKREQIDRLTRERDSALAAEDEAKDAFWAVYPTYCQVTGGGITKEAAHTSLSSRVKVLEGLVEQAFREGVEYGESADFPEYEAAWSQSRTRATLQKEQSDGI